MDLFHGQELSSIDTAAFKRGRALTRLLFIGASALGAWAGARIALALFPHGAFGLKLTDQVGRDLVGFVCVFGIPFAVSQWLVMQLGRRYIGATHPFLLVLWIPITSIGITLMLVPLLWWDPGHFWIFPSLVFFPMLPGTIVLGAMQCLLLRQVIPAGHKWIISTILGLFFGSFFGWLPAKILSHGGTIDVFEGGRLGEAFEPAWALVIGLGIGILQAITLLPVLRGDRQHQYVRRQHS